MSDILEHCLGEHLLILALSTIKPKVSLLVFNSRNWGSLKDVEGDEIHLKV